MQSLVRIQVTQAVRGFHLRMPSIRSRSVHASRQTSSFTPSSSRSIPTWGSKGAKRAVRTATSFWSALIVLAIFTSCQTRQSPQIHFQPQQDHDGDGARLRIIPYEEIQKHVSPDDCWVIIEGRVYDVTSFLELHPGGRQAIISEAGKDASRLFSMVHPSNALDTFPRELCVGVVDPTTLPTPVDAVLTDAYRKRREALEVLPMAENMLLLQDFEEWAEKILTDVAWAYYRSAADEERTFHENRDAFQRYFFRPRILRDATHGTIATTIVGIPSALPIFISPAAMAKLGHPLGEVNLTRAAGDMNIIQMISSNASCSLEEMFAARRNQDQPLIFQLYLNKDRSASEALIRKVNLLGAQAIVLTVDVCWESKRTMDMRAKVASATPSSVALASSESKPKSSSLGVAQAIGGYQDRNLTWKDIGFIRRNTTLPIIVKGVQCIEDVQLCVENGVDGVILSNHGGRQADYSPAPIDILYEIRTLRPELFDEIEIMIDGGVRCGADVVKALALGARAVGVGRPFLYANGTHGQEGVSRVIEILHEEITNTMRNIGATSIEELKPEMVGPAGPWVGSNRPSYAPRL